MTRRIAAGKPGSDPKDVYFYHMPKTGGGSVSTMLSKCQTYDKRNVYYNSINMHGGHTAFTNGRYDVPDKDGTVITWIRNPASITYSAYHYFRRGVYLNPDKLDRPRPDEPLGGMIWDIQHTASLEHYANEVEFPYPYGWWPDISQFDFVGVTEAMEGSIKALGVLLDLEIPYDAEKRNTCDYDRTERPGEDRLNELFRKERAEWESRLNEVKA